MASREQTILQFAPSPTSLSAKVHPLVIFNICDCFVRRPDQAERVIGTLLGSVLPDGTVDIRNSYAVPHNESSDQVTFSFFKLFFLSGLFMCKIIGKNKQDSQMYELLFCFLLFSFFVRNSAINLFDQVTRL